MSKADEIRTIAKDNAGKTLDEVVALCVAAGHPKRRALFFIAQVRDGVVPATKSRTTGTRPSAERTAAPSAPADVYVPDGSGRKKGLTVGRLTRQVGVGMRWFTCSIGDKDCEVGFSFVNDVVNWTVMTAEDALYKLFADELSRYSDKELAELLP